MLPAWRLAISTARARPGRTLLLAGAVMLSAALIAAVSCAMASATKAVAVRLDQTVGRAELRVLPTGGASGVPTRVLEQVRQWPEAKSATGRAQASLGLAFERPLVVVAEGALPGKVETRRVECLGTAQAWGIDPDLEPQFRAIDLVSGRLPRGPDEIVVDEALLKQFGQPAAGTYRDLGAWSEAAGPAVLGGSQQEIDAENARHAPVVGSTLRSVRFFREPIALTIVGVMAQPPFGTRWQTLMTHEGLARVSSRTGEFSEIDIILRDEVSPQEVVELRSPELGRQLLLQTTARITSGLNQNMQAGQLGFIMATLMAFLAAAFIITTGLSTAVTERMRELAVLRCIGADRWQLARTQLATGVIIGGLGAVAGLPLGIGAAYLMGFVFSEHLPEGVSMSVFGIVVAGIGAVLCGVAGAVFPAVKAARISPLEGLSVRSRPPKKGTLPLLAAVGACLLVIEMLVVFIPEDGQTAFWGYATVGLPAMFMGYFLMGPPLTTLLSGVLGRPLSRALWLPPTLLGRAVERTPYRYGFTAGAMMSGLAIMVAIWTQGRSIVNDWLDRFEFPDAFVLGVNLTQEAKAKLDSLPFVTDTCAISLHPIETNAFGVRALQRYKSMFIAFEPEPFFRMTRLTWVEPKDPAGQERAQRRLAEGGAVLVAREFQAAKGIGVGDTFRAASNEKEVEFEIVGVVTSPGLEVVSKFFSVGEDFTDQAIHAVFGSRKDLLEVFGSDAISMFQVGLDPAYDDTKAVATMRTELIDYGILDAGSGRSVKKEIRRLIGGSLVIASAVALFAMIIASFGVANIIVASIRARMFEFGVLRAVGASKGLLARMVLAEALLIGLAAIILGTALGIQGIYSGQRLDKLLFGLELTVRPPVVPILIGWAFILTITVAATVPSLLLLLRRRPRELLAGTRG
jgi:putative ABC transport system permease protein